MLEKRITLDFFPDAVNYYHVYRISRSEVAEVPHSHDFFQVCYVNRGNLIHRQGRDEVLLEKGDAFIIPPNFSHSIISNDSDTVYSSLSFQEPLFQPHFCYSYAYKFLKALQLDTIEKNRIDVQLKVKLDETQHQNFEALMTCLIRESKIELGTDETMAGNLIASMLTILARGYFTQPSAQKQLASINEYHEIITACMENIDLNYMKPLTVSQLSKQFAISVSSFGFWFPEIAGITFKRYLNKKRIEHAIALTSINSLPFCEIAYLVGYKNNSTFYRNFIKIMGISPAKFREKLQSTTGAADRQRGPSDTSMRK
jgi:AraC-like DNA-binding protein